MTCQDSDLESVPQYDIEINQRASFSLELVVSDATNAPLDLTGYSFQAQLRKKASDTALIASLTCTPDPDQAANPGVLLLSLTAAQTAALRLEPSEEAKRHVTRMAWDLIMISPDTSVERILEGQALLSPGVTRG